jgi:ribonuclease D
MSQMPETASARRVGQPPQWIRTPEALRALVAHFAGTSVMALDTESDSLHHFPEKVCLIQVAHPDGTVFLVDPLALRDLSPLGPLCADPGIIKVLHGASYDLSSLKRDFGFGFAHIFDTMLSGQLIGLSELGLAALLQRFFGLVPGRSRQKDDWARRPLSPEQEAYAAEDVRYLVSLRERLRAELQALGREAWLEEECEALVLMPPGERIFDPEDYLRIKGAKDLDRRGLAVLRELFVGREAWAGAAARPPFRIVGNETLIHLVLQRPRSLTELSTIPGCTPGVIRRHGEPLLAAIARGLAVPEAELPSYSRPKKPRASPATARRIDALLAWRGAAALRAGLDPGFLLPRRLIERLAEAVPGDREALDRIEGLRRWRVEAFGAEILGALAAAR